MGNPPSSSLSFLHGHSLLGRGFGSDVYAWGEGRVLKLFHASISRAKVEREFDVTRAIHAAGLPAPAVYDCTEIEGRHGIILERIDGASMLSYCQARPWALFAVVRRLAELQARLHDCIAPAELPTQRERIAERIDRAVRLGEAERKEARRRLADLPDGTAVCHGDFHPGNILFADRGPVIIDWETASRGHPLGDVTCTSRLMRHASLPSWAPGYMHLLLRCLRPQMHRVYLRHYRRLRPGNQCEIDAWDAPLAAAMVGLRARASQPGVKNAARFVFPPPVNVGMSLPPRIARREFMPRFLAVFAILAASGAAFAEPPAPAKSAPLRFKWQVGQVQTYKVAQQTVILETTIDEKTSKPTVSEARTDLALTRQWKVKDVDAQGVATLEMQITAVRNEFKKPDGTTDLRDSSVPEQAKEMADYLNKPVVVVRVDNQGKLVEVKEVKTGSANRLLAELPFRFVLPDEGPSDGQTWERFFAFKTGADDSYDFVQKYTCKSMKDGLAIIGVSTALKTQPKTTGEQVPLVPMFWTGDVYFNALAGKYHAARLTAKVELMNHLGEGSKFIYQSTYNEDAADK